MLCARTAAASRYADGDTAGAIATSEDAAAGLATPPYRLAEVLRAAP